MRKNPKDTVRSMLSGIAAVQPPMSFYANAVSRLTGVEATYGKEGRVRSLMSGSATGLGTLPFGGDPLAHAKQFLATPTISNTLGLRNVNLVDGRTDRFDFGTCKLNRVEMAQVVKIGDQDIPVRGGFVHVSMDDFGKVVNVTNTVKFGRRPNALPKKMLTGEAAINVCKTKLAVDTAVGTSRLVLSEHEGKFGFVYEVKLSSQSPRHAMIYLVLAKTGEIVYEQSLIHTSVASAAQDVLKRIPVKTFLAIPDPKKPIPQQVVDHYIESLKDPKVLEDHRFILLVREGGKWVGVKAKEDGSYNFDAEKESSKFSAVVTYVALRAQYEFLESLGMKKQDRPIKVFIDDPDVQDNAYFDGENYEIHMGVGSGTRRGGLAVNISWDLGVEWHENGHHVVFLQCPGKDLPGSEGGAMHESTGDVLGQLVMQYLWGALYGKQLGNELTVTMIKADRRIIGAYALPPNGIRIQRNNKKTPKDRTGQVHDDGLISGGAHADLLEAMIDNVVTGGKTIVDGVTDFAKLYLAALALVPAHTVRFTDMLRAMQTADSTLFGGKYAALIVKANADHGIVASKVADDTAEKTIDIEVDEPVVETKTPGKGRGRKGSNRRRKTA
jgi:Zn-dependent metalloprotease